LSIFSTVFGHIAIVQYDFNLYARPTIINTAAGEYMLGLGGLEVYYTTAAGKLRERENVSAKLNEADASSQSPEEV